MGAQVVEVELEADHEHEEDEAELTDQVETADGPEEAAMRGADAQRARELLSALPETLRELLVLRVAVHRSELPSPPGRLEKKKTSSPSNRTDEPASLAVLLSSETGVASPNVPSGEAGTFFRLLGDQHVSDSLTLDGDDAASGYARAMEWTQKLTQFVMDGRVLFEVPLGEMFWLGLFDAIHHRGQLSVYLRPMGGRVPSIYGPSADDPGT